MRLHVPFAPRRGWLALPRARAPTHANINQPTTLPPALPPARTRSHPKAPAQARVHGSRPRRAPHPMYCAQLASTNDTPYPVACAHACLPAYCLLCLLCLLHCFLPIPPAACLQCPLLIMQYALSARALFTVRSKPPSFACLCRHRPAAARPRLDTPPTSPEAAARLRLCRRHAARTAPQQHNAAV